MDIKDNIDLKIIKRHYGEEFAKMCRDNFSTILETPMLLSSMIMEHLEPNKTFMQDVKNEINDFKNYIYSFLDEKDKQQDLASQETAEELFDKAGYILYPECKTEKDIQKFKKYYASGEELCTFRGNRLNSCRVWFAVKKNVDEINREDFAKPSRQDEYGTSVISIQYTKSSPSYLSIKNRYNHSVSNPDATFSNDLDNIYPDLNEVMEKQFGIKRLSNKIIYELPHYVQVNNKLYKYNYESGNVYYCPNNIIIHNFQVKRFDKARYIVFDKYILDKSDKTITVYDDEYRFEIDSGKPNPFVKSFGKIVNIQEQVSKGKRDICITNDKGEVTILGISDEGKLQSYKNDYIKKIEEKFLHDAYFLKKFSAAHLKEIERFSMNKSDLLEELYIPEVVKIENGSFGSPCKLKNIDLPNVECIEDCVFSPAESLESFNAPKLKKIEDYVLYKADNLSTLNVPKLEYMGNCSLNHVDALTKLDAPNLLYIGHDCLVVPSNLVSFNAPKLEYLGHQTLRLTPNLESINVPSLKKTGSIFLLSYAPKLLDANIPDEIMKDNHNLEVELRLRRERLARDNQSSPQNDLEL